MLNQFAGKEVLQTYYKNNGSTSSSHYFGSSFRQGGEDTHSWSSNTLILGDDDDNHDNGEDEQEDDNEDRCTPNGEVCLYNHVCYNLDSSQRWETSNGNVIGGRPLLNNIAMDNRQEVTKDSPWLYSYSQCNEQFQPVLLEEGIDATDTQRVLFVDGTTYYVCCWIDHFGHILMNMVAPAFNALTKFGIGQEELGRIKFLVHQRTGMLLDPLDSVWRLFSFVTGGGKQGNGKNEKRVLSFNELRKEAVLNRKSHLCFEKLVVGMYDDSLIGVGIGDRLRHKQLEVGQLQSLRKHLRDIYPTSNENISAALEETLVSKPTTIAPIKNSDKRKVTSTAGLISPPECTITLLERKPGTTRQIINRNETLQVIDEVFEPSMWKFRRVIFEPEDSSVLSQYMTIQSTMVQISITGTGSHMSMFLPDGAFDVQLKYAPNFHNNDAICGVIPTINCFDINPPEDFILNKDYEILKEGNLQIDLKEFRTALQKVHDQLLPRCKIASNNLFF